MNLDELRQQAIKDEFQVSNSYGKILAIIDFGNVNHWFSNDDRDNNGDLLAVDQRIIIDIEKLKCFLENFSIDVRFYYGHDPSKQGSQDFIRAAKAIYGKHRVFTKPMQKIRHYLSNDEMLTNTRDVLTDRDGSKYILIPKCNFDVEISVDSIRKTEDYDTLCLLSGDSDFLPLMRYLRCSYKKKAILIKGGFIQSALAKEIEITGKIINAQDIKKYIITIKQKPGV